jgi:hypothetical protein
MHSMHKAHKMNTAYGVHMQSSISQTTEQISIRGAALQ